MKTKLPRAPAAVSRHINNLAAIRRQMRALRTVASHAVKTIVAYGSCHNEEHCAYVSHAQASRRWVTSKSRSSVRLVRRKNR